MQWQPARHDLNHLLPRLTCRVTGLSTRNVAQWPEMSCTRSRRRSVSHDAGVIVTVAVTERSRGLVGANYRSQYLPVILNLRLPAPPRRRSALSALFVALAVTQAHTRANAQGVAGAALQGTVTTASGAPLPDARVSLVDSSTGRRWNTMSSGHGSFSFESVPAGGPYTLEARALGFTPGATPGIVLHLGDRLTRRVVLAEAVQNLASILVRESVSRDAGAGGPVHDVPGEAVRSLPLLKRDFVGLLVMAPQATGSPSISINGQSPRLNAIQVDGGSASDYLGLNVTPGASVGARALSLEALQELRILIAPFDVRQGGFSGGLINAVTRSGTNQFRGATFMSIGRNELVGADTAGKASNPFTTLQYGFSAGGPIIRDRLHYFVVADLQSQQTPAVGLSVSDSAVGASDSIASRITRVLRDRYNVDPGSAEVPVLQQPNGTLFMKLSWQPASAHLIELTNNFTDARSDALLRGPSTPSRDGWQLSHSGSQTHVRNVTTRVKATSTFGAVSNELITSMATANSDFTSTTRTPLFLIGNTAGQYALAAGSTKNAQDISTNQRIIELTDNLTWSRGDHVFTIGGQSQFLRMFDNFFLGKWGTWTFASAAALEQGVAQRYDIAFPLPGRPEGPLVDYAPHQLAGYAQDRWNVTPNLTLTAGMRADAPFFGGPPANPALLENAALGRIDTHRLPSGNGVISPRLGFAYDMGHDRAWLLRGGIGGFAGHAPYLYVNGAYANTGQEQASLTCKDAAAPPPTADINHLPTRCVNSPGAKPPKPSVTLFDPDFRFQQAVKFDLGMEHDVGNGVTASVDVIHTRTRNTPFMQDVNLAEMGTNAEGRVMYGRITNKNSGFEVNPARLDDAAFGPVYRFENRSEDRSSSLTLELQKHWPSGLLQVGYNWSRSYDVMSMAGNVGPNIMAVNPIDGTMSSRNLRRSARDIPHNLVVTALAPLAFGVSASAFFRARSGTPYSYVYSAPVGNVIAGDANADGFNNDLVYVPRDSQDVTLSDPATYGALDAFIAGESCLNEQRGRIMARNSCRNPAVFVLDTRFAKRLGVMSAHGAEIGVDVFNLPNLLRSNWGITRETAAAEGIGVLSVAGWDEVAGRPRYSVLKTLPARSRAVPDVSRWRMQLSARLDF